jgi:hypothetical protein
MLLPRARLRQAASGRPSLKEKTMKLLVKGKQKWEEAKVGWALLWLIGVPIPVLAILFLMRGCT